MILHNRLIFIKRIKLSKLDFLKESERNFMAESKCLLVYKCMQILIIYFYLFIYN